MNKYFIVSDVHSFFDELMVALSKKGFERDNPKHKIIVCGDLLDRGNGTVKVFEFAKEMAEQDRLIYIKGNHEQLLKDCVKEISMGRIPDMHHFSNGTVKTICQFCGQNELIIYDPSWRNKILETMQPILDFIDEKCVNYVEFKNMILVHSWVPLIKKDNLPAYYTRGRKFEFNPDWRNAKQEDWDEATWGNPFDMAERGLNQTKKTIVFGHWHASTGWAKAKGHSEFGNDAKFDPYYGDGIIAIDACTAYTGKVNCIVIEE